MQVPDIVVPAPLARLVSRLPVAPPSWALAQVLNQMRRRGVLPADMSLLAGRRYEIEVRDLGLRLRFTASARGFRAAAAGVPDLRLSATLADFARMMLREEDPDTLFFHRRLVIEGDTELGLVVKNLLDSVDWSRTPLARWMTP
ncbi:MAG: SCP2 sterol-binding domain-containing protein [Burkholderiales bacterium]|nr:SCP2 sterol-binding domain-containing protein [Burkholderiales bacterium]